MVLPQSKVHQLDSTYMLTSHQNVTGTGGGDYLGTKSSPVQRSQDPLLLVSVYDLICLFPKYTKDDWLLLTIPSWLQLPQDVGNSPRYF
jgi:hypothetical protein